jgi:hypothetical protein
MGPSHRLGDKSIHPDVLKADAIKHFARNSEFMARAAGRSRSCENYPSAQARERVSNTDT